MMQSNPIGSLVKMSSKLPINNATKGVTNNQISVASWPLQQHGTKILMFDEYPGG